MTVSMALIIIGVWIILTAVADNKEVVVSIMAGAVALGIVSVIGFCFSQVMEVTMGEGMMMWFVVMVVGRIIKTVKGKELDNTPEGL